MVGASKNIDDTRGREHYCCSDGRETERGSTSAEARSPNNTVNRTSRCIVGKRRTESQVFSLRTIRTLRTTMLEKRRKCKMFFVWTTGAYMARNYRQQGNGNGTPVEGNRRPH